MRIKDYFGDSLGQFALNLIATLVGQLMYFYTDKIGIAAGATAMMLLICKGADAVAGLIMGNIIDHTKSGKEKYRPWLLKGGIPAGITLVLVLTVPKAGSTGQLLYALITNLLLTSVFFTAVSVPYSSLMVVRTKNQKERSMMGIWRAGAGYVAGMLIAIAVIPITNILGGTQNAWIKFGAVIAMIAVLAFLVSYLSSRETPTEEKNQEEKEATLPFKEAIPKLFRNKYWVIVLLLSLLSNILYGIVGAAGTYYCKWIFGNDNLIGIMGSIGLIPTALGFGLAAPMIKKLGVVKTLKLSFAMGIAANMLLIVWRNSFMAYIILGSVTTFATIPMMCLAGVMTAMAIDYNEYKYGVKMVATSNSASSFGGKVGGGIGASLIGWMLAVVHYDSSLAVATQATKLAIYGFAIVVPLIVFLIMYILIGRFDIERKLPGMKQEAKKKGNTNYEN